MPISYIKSKLNQCEFGHNRANTRPWPNAGLTLAHRLRRWPNFGPTPRVCWEIIGVLCYTITFTYSLKAMHCLRKLNFVDDGNCH